MSGNLPTTFKEANYAKLLNQVKSRIREARVRAGLAANRELVALYWGIGKLIIERQRAKGWGSAVIERLSRDVRQEFPDIQGFSPRNICRMRAFYLAYTEKVRNLPQPAAGFDGENLLQIAAEMPWMHNAVLIEKVKDLPARVWYMRQSIEHGWSRSILELHIQQGDYDRKGQAVTNFSRTLPAPQSDLARDILKDPYIFHVTDEWQYTNGQETNRADVMLLINGLPVAIIETKSAKNAKGIQEGLIQIREYHHEIPEMLTAPLSTAARKSGCSPAASTFTTRTS